jgi:ribosome maturation factor RimP
MLRRRSAAASRRPEPDERLDSASDFKQHLGRRVSLRYRLHDDPAHPFSEAIGVVMAVEEDEAGHPSVVILTKKSKRRVVPIDDVLAGKLFPL